MFDFFPNEQQGTLLNAARHPSIAPDPSAFQGFARGAGMYAMRSLAEAGRAVDLLGAVGPIAVDAITGGTERQDRYFHEHDEVFNNAVDYWTPAPGEVGIAGQVAGQLAGGVLQAVVSPALLVGTTQLSAAEDLVREGVAAGTANAVGAVQGAGMAVGVRLPFLGQRLATRMLSGAGGNLAQGIGTAAGSSALLKGEGYDRQGEPYNPWDVRARLLDVMLGAAFGGLAHLEAKLTPTDEAALLVANQARHLEDATPPGRPASDVDATKHVDAMRQAVEQVLRGEPVTVDDIVKDMALVPDEALVRQRAEVGDEIQHIASEQVGSQPIALDVTPEPPRDVAAPADTALPTRIMQTVRDTVSGLLGKTHVAEATPRADTPERMRALSAIERNPEARIPTAQADADGNVTTLRAADALTLADAEVAHVEATAADVFKTAANCLLGVL